ncbi:MAG: thioredoxin family protein [Planctomycetaceae bacterium]
MRRWSFLVWGLLVLVQTAGAGEFNTVLNVGDPAPVWSDLPGTDGKTHSLADLKDAKAVVVVFTCNSCPVATEYEDRIIAFAKKHAGEVAVVAINVNRIEEDNLEHMKERAKSKQFPYLYLFDETQKIAKDFGATYTPEFYVLGADRKIVYMGGMDDNSDPAIVTENYLEPAIESALKGTPLKTKETRAIGCRVRYARVRK